MAVRFYLYRLKLSSKVHSDQQLLFEMKATKPALLERLIMLRPFAVVRKGIEWVIADSKKVTNTGIFFNFGRVKKREKDHIDREARSFYAIIDDDVEKVSCFYDVEYQILAIEKSSGAPSSETVSKYICTVINSCKENEEILSDLSDEEKYLLASTKPQIDVITDPVDFISYIENSYKVSFFEVIFSPENVFDYDKMLQAPLQKLMDAAGGDKSSASVASDDGLKTDIIIELSHAAAAHGDNAKARIQSGEDSAPETIKLKKRVSDAYIEFPDNFVDEKEKILNSIRDKYNKIRG